MGIHDGSKLGFFFGAGASIEFGIPSLKLLSEFLDNKSFISMASALSGEILVLRCFRKYGSSPSVASSNFCSKRGSFLEYVRFSSCLIRFV
jgi:hypothetical protein